MAGRPKKESSPRIQMTIFVEPDLFGRVEAAAKRVVPGLEMNRSDTVRILLLRGLTAVEGGSNEEVPKFRRPPAAELSAAIERWRLERLESDIAADDREDEDDRRKGGAT